MKLRRVSGSKSEELELNEVKEELVEAKSEELELNEVKEELVEAKSEELEVNELKRVSRSKAKGKNLNPKKAKIMMIKHK